MKPYYPNLGKRFDMLMWYQACWLRLITENYVRSRFNLGDSRSTLVICCRTCQEVATLLFSKIPLGRSRPEFARRSLWCTIYTGNVFQLLSLNTSEFWKTSG